MPVLTFIDRKTENYLLTAILVTISVVLVVQVFMRYFVNSPLVWAEELARYLLVWCTMIGTSLAVRESRHIVVDFAPVLFGPRSVGIFRLISMAGIIVFSIVVIYYSVPFVQRVQQMNQLSPSLEIPMWWVYLALPVGAAASILRAIQQVYLQLRYGLATPEPEVAEVPPVAASQIQDKAGR
ncbi:TRAP-type C4-dicarboxylate transport system, small permease component [Devosia crocina]|uniref:TRAP transporter small permease protein n=1 Tax=Devosia crocina TaxID=429728 RepID=A0A1I7N7Q4_9HYPH|nr:TRAP transporter small permease [Devosia crocina]SFV30700.1 TRAP-type C4-dicarboxylate transport system, small permease component [Devosia crocina]